MMSLPKAMFPRNRTLGFSAVLVNVFMTFLTSGWSGATPKLWNEDYCEGILFFVCFVSVGCEFEIE